MKRLNQQMVKENNLKLIYLLISRGEQTSRAELARHAELTKTTVSALVDELIAGGFVVENPNPPGEAKVGRKPGCLRVCDDHKAFAVVSWRQDRMIYALVGLSYEVLLLGERPFANKAEGAASIAEICSGEILDKAAERGLEILGFCVVVPAIVDGTARKLNSTIIPISNSGKEIESIRKNLPGYPIAFLNDSACFAYAESVLGGVREKDYALINLNSGVGACLFSDGKMLRGAGAMATQFGHVSLDRNGAPCDCGNRGCLENRIGERGLPSRASVFGIEKAECVTYAGLAAAAEAGDEKASALLLAVAEDLSFGLSTLVALCNPKLIVIGGNGRKLGVPFLETIKSEMLRRGFREFVSRVDLRFSSLDESAEFQGAAAYFMDTHYRFTSSIDGQLYLG